MIAVRNGVAVCFWVLAVGVSFAGFAGPDEEAVPFFQLPESPIAGGRLFMEKGCVSCHAIQGLGGTGGPDLGKVQAPWSFLDIAGVMWNHDPKMEAEFKRRRIVRPTLTSGEMFQLIAFVYFLNYFGNPGDAAKGELIFLRKGCFECHSVGGDGAPEMSPLDRFRLYRSPAVISAALWNTSKNMRLAMSEQDVPQPVFEANDIVDILAYIRREAAPQQEDRLAYLEPGSSRKGAVLFREKGCVHCHAVRGEGGEVGPALDSWESSGVLSQMAGAIWNHGPDMWASMEEAGIEFQEFSPEEMSDLMTYLYFTSFIDPPGDPEVGRRHFEEKGCVACHEMAPGGVPAGLDISQMQLLSASGVIAAMWNHASEMEEAVRSVNVAWPQFKPGEMRDLVAFIESRSEARSDP